MILHSICIAVKEKMQTAQSAPGSLRQMTSTTHQNGTAALPKAYVDAEKLGHVLKTRLQQE